MRTKKLSVISAATINWPQVSRLIGLPLALVALMSGCATVQNPDGTTKKTASYGGLGALAGAAAGALINHDNRGKGALIGAALGSAGGAALGYRADKQEAELRQQMQGTGVEVQRQGDEIRLVMPGAITFPTGSDQLQPAFQDTLNRLSGSLAANPGSSVEVTGHTDNVGSQASNNDLSERRAIAVAKVLAQGGVEKSRIKVFGAGPSQPITSNATEQGRAKNRRVEIKLVGMPEPIAAN